MFHRSLHVRCTQPANHPKYLQRWHLLCAHLHDFCMRLLCETYSIRSAVVTCGDAAALPGAIPVRITTATAFPGLYSVVTSVAVVLNITAVAAVSTVGTSVVATPVLVIILISSVMSVIISIAPAPLAM